MLTLPLPRMSELTCSNTALRLIPKQKQRRVRRQRISTSQLHISAKPKKEKEKKNRDVLRVCEQPEANVLFWLNDLSPPSLFNCSTLSQQPCTPDLDNHVFVSFFFLCFWGVSSRLIFFSAFIDGRSDVFLRRNQRPLTLPTTTEFYEPFCANTEPQSAAKLYRSPI